MQDLIYLPVEQGIYVDDLFDWSDITQKCKHTIVVVNKKGLNTDSQETGKLVDCNEEQIALFRHGLKVYAVKEKCPHAGGPLHLGDIEEMPNGDLCVRCPWHNWQFDLYSGNVKFPKGHNKSTVTYNVKVEQNGQILIGFHRLSEKYFQIDDQEF